MRSENMQYNPHYILWEHFGRCGLAMGIYNVPQNVFLVLKSPLSFDNGWTNRKADCCVNTVDEKD